MQYRLLPVLLGAALLLGAGLTACTPRSNTQGFLPASHPITAQAETPPPTDDGGGSLPGK